MDAADVGITVVGDKDSVMAMANPVLAISVLIHIEGGALVVLGAVDDTRFDKSSSDDVVGHGNPPSCDVVFNPNKRECSCSNMKSPNTAGSSSV